MSTYRLDGHITRTDRSRDTGTLVVCTCGAVLGPLLDHARALKAADDHRNVHRRRDLP